MTALKNILSYCAAALLLIFAFKYLLTDQHRNLLFDISLFNLSVSVLITFIIYLIFGFQYFYVVNTSSHVRLTPGDVCLLPLSMSLWGYIIPFKGGLVYSTALLKFKYRVKIVKGLAMSIYMYLISLFLTGAIGLYFVMKNNLILSIITFFSLLLLLSPFSVFLLIRLVLRIPAHGNAYMEKMKSIALDILNNTRELGKNPHAFMIMVLLNILQIILSVFLYYWASVVFHLTLPFLSIVMLTLILQLSIIFRFTPGNLGVEQVISGSAVVMLGGTMGDGVLISLFVSLTTIVISFTLGGISTLRNLRYFNVSDFRSLFTSLRS